MKHVLAYLCARKDLESNFHHCGGPVKLVQACLYTRKDLESSLHHSWGPVRLVQACLRGRKDLESWFHRRGSPVRLVQDCFMCQQRSRKQFSPLCSSCEVRTSLCKCGKCGTSPF